MRETPNSTFLYQLPSTVIVSSNSLKSSYPKILDITKIVEETTDLYSILIKRYIAAAQSTSHRGILFLRLDR